MLISAAVLGLLAAIFTAISHLWFRKDQFDKTTTSRSARDRFLRAVHWRAEVGLDHDFRRLRRWAAVACVTVVAVMLVWGFVGPRDFPYPSQFAGVFFWLFFVWCSLDFWVDPKRMIRKFFFPLVVLPTGLPWLALLTNRFLLGSWGVAPFDALFHHSPWASLFVESSPVTLAAIASALYLAGALLLLLFYIVMFSTLPLGYLLLVGPPTWSARRWVAMPEDNKHNLMLMLDFTGRIILAPLVALIVLARAWN